MLLSAAVVLVFPSIAIWALQSGGSRRLFRIPGVSLAAVGVVLFMDTLEMTPLLVLPLVATAAVVRLFSTCLSRAALFVAAAVTCFLSWVLVAWMVAVWVGI